MNKDNFISDASDLRRYRIELPNLVDDFGLDVYAFRLYVHIKRVAGAIGGQCTQGTSTLAKSCRMSAGRISKAKKDLLDAGLVTITETPCNGGMLDAISIVDIWAKNFEKFAPRCSPDEQGYSPDEHRCSCGEQRCSRGERGCSPRETKKEHIKNKPNKKERTTAPRAGERDPNLDNPSVIAYRDIAKVTPNEVQRKVIADAAINLDLWKSKVTEWIASGWNKYNVAGMVRFYSEPPRQQRSTQQTPTVTQTADEKSQDALELLRQGAV